MHRAPPDRLAGAVQWEGMNINPTILGFIRGLGAAVIFAALTYLGNADHLTFLSPEVAGVVAGIVIALEHALAGSALFGAAKAR